MRLNRLVRRAIDSPIGTTYELLDLRAGERDLLDLAQAAPQYPPAPEVADRIAAIARDAHGADYVEIAGLPELREAFAAELSHDYRGTVRPDNIVVTAGCNQAFCLAVSTLAAPGDEVILALPFYFNHDMWLRMNGIRPRYLDPSPGLVPSAADCRALMTDRVRAIVLVTPGNPSGVTLTPEAIAEFAALAAEYGVALIVDETYRSFRGTDEPAHALFTDPAWEQTVVSLHSFSKDLAIPGYRVGAVIGGEEFNRQLLKLLDCVAICAPRVGQEAALAGLLAAKGWRADRAAEVAAKKDTFTRIMDGRPGGFELLSAGGFFGWVRHPFADQPTEEVVGRLVVKHDTLVIPGTAFMPDDRGTFRVSFSNASEPQLVDFGGRLAEAGI